MREVRYCEAAHFCIYTPPGNSIGVAGINGEAGGLCSWRNPRQSEAAANEVSRWLSAAWVRQTPTL